jgi:hypothetical protein
MTILVCSTSRLDADEQGCSYDGHELFIYSTTEQMILITYFHACSLKTIERQKSFQAMAGLQCTKNLTYNPSSFGLYRLQVSEGARSQAAPSVPSQNAFWPSQKKTAGTVGLGHQW